MIQRMIQRRAVLLVGSSRPRGTSTSGELGRYLLGRLEPAGFRGSTFLANHLLDDAAIAAFLAAVDAAEIFIISTPLYVDSLPWLVTRTLERLAAHRRAAGAHDGCRCLAIVNCGFPESHHTRTALDICRIFARQAHMEWAGGLGLGGGEAIGGRSLEAAGSMARNVRRALDLTAAAIDAEEPVLEEAVRLMAKRLVPVWLYMLIAEFGWRLRARRNGVLDQLWARPYAVEAGDVSLASAPPGPPDPLH